MSSVRRGRGLAAWVVVAALACAGVLAFEARRRPAAKTWFELTAGLGIGSQAGFEDGWFAYDPRLESSTDGSFEPLPGAAIGAGPGGGVFTLAPFSR